MEYFKYNLFFGNESVLWGRRGKNRSGEGLSRLVGREGGCATRNVKVHMVNLYETEGRGPAAKRDGLLQIHRV